MAVESFRFLLVYPGPVSSSCFEDAELARAHPLAAIPGARLEAVEVEETTYGPAPGWLEEGREHRRFVDGRELLAGAPEPLPGVDVLYRRWVARSAYIVELDSLAAVRALFSVLNGERPTSLELAARPRWVRGVHYSMVVRSQAP